MTTKMQFSLLFSVGLLMGIVVESHILRPLSQLGNASAGAIAHSTSYAQAKEPAKTLVDLQPVPTLADSSALPPNDQKKSPVPFVAGIPQISVDETVFDFGERDTGEVVEHTFTLTNHGDGTLLIDKVKTNCGCTVAQISTQSIPPGGKADVILKLNLHLQKGKQNRTALVQSNDPSTPNLKLALVGNAVYRVALNPQRVMFGEFENNDPRTEMLTVKADKTVKPFKVLRTRTSGENVEAEVEVMEPGKEFSVKLKVTPQANVAKFRGWAHLITDHPGEYRVIGIPISATFPSSGGSGEEVSTLSPQNANKYSLAAEIGETLEIKGTTLDGDPIDLVNYEGKPTLVVFWSSTCSACRNEFASLKDLYEDYHDKGLQVLGINLDTSIEQRQKYLDEANLPWPNIGRENGLPFAKRYKVRRIPSVALMDRTGKIIAIDRRDESLRQAVSGMFESQKGI